MTLPCIFTNNKMRPVINIKKPEGWEKYKKISAYHAHEIGDAMDNIKDINELRVKIHIINMRIQVESFGKTWEGPSKQKEREKKTEKRPRNYSLSSRRNSMSLLKKGLSLKTLTAKFTDLKT